MNKVLIICGPTATGKTKVALELARKFNGELVSADSRQVYIGMDIGTGKDLPPNSPKGKPTVSVEISQKVYHLEPYLVDTIPLWLYDIVSPDEEFSVSLYQNLAGRVIEDIQARGKLPIIVGGTGLYIKSLLEPLETAVVPPDPQLREKLASFTISELQNRLKDINPDLYQSLNHSDRHNPRRLIRKIEISSSSRLLAIYSPRTVDALLIGLAAPFAVLKERIQRRVDARVESGIIEEINRLLKKGYRWDSQAMSGLGYHEWQPLFQISNLNDQILKHEIIEKWKRDEYQYAKRQMTWFKKQPKISWFSVTEVAFEASIEAQVAPWYTT